MAHPLLQPLTPKGAAICTGIAALMFLVGPVYAYKVTHLWLVLLMIGLYLGGAVWTLRLQLKNPASALLMMRVFVIPSGVMCILAFLLMFAAKGQLHELQVLQDVGIQQRLAGS